MEHKMKASENELRNDSEETSASHLSINQTRRRIISGAIVAPVIIASSTQTANAWGTGGGGGGTQTSVGGSTGGGW